jgi:uncharacterized OsmC-like protein
VARFAPLYEVPIQDATADVRGTFRNTEKYDVDDAPPYFEEVTIALAITSEAAADQVGRLVRHAERACHAAQTLRHGVPVRLSATLNGAQIGAPET